MKEKGKTLQEVAAWVEKNKLHICHNVAVDDLNHLYRGGRLSRTSAVVGSMINIKPFIHMDENGKLVPIGKVRVRKTSLNILVDDQPWRLYRRCQICGEIGRRAVWDSQYFD